MGESSNERLERFDEGRAFLRLELVQGVPNLGFAQLAEMGADLLRGGRSGNQDPPAVGRIGGADEMTRIDQPIDQLRGCGHRAVNGGGDLADGHLPARTQLEQHLYLSGRKSVGVTESGDGGEEGSGDDRHQPDAGLD